MTLVLLCLVVLVAFAVEAAAGFGGTVVMVTLASQLMPIESVLLRCLHINLGLSLFIVVRHRAHVDLRLLGRRILPFMGIGVGIGMLLPHLFNLPQNALKVVFALFVVTLSLTELRKLARGDESSPKLPFATAAAGLVGAGVLHGLFACGGPLAVWVIGREVPNKSVFRATLSLLWVVLNLVLIASFVAQHKITPVVLKESGALLVPLALGIAVGERVHHALSPQRFRWFVFLLLFFAASALLVRSLFAMRA